MDLASRSSSSFFGSTSLCSSTYSRTVWPEAKALLAYDEANSYRSDGTTLEAPTAFWSALAMRELTSVHFKQKAPAGVLPCLAEGFVDFAAILRRLRKKGFTGDLLLENAPSESPLEDALQSRAYLRTRLS